MLQIDEDQPFQEKVWVVQRIGWGLLLAFLLCAAFGLTGPSPLTLVEEEKEGNRLEYPRFARRGTSFEMVVRLAQGRSLSFSREILRKNEIETVTPLPLKGQTKEGGMDFTFENSGQGEIHLDWKPREAGWTRGRIRLGEPPVEFELRQLVYF